MDWLEDPSCVSTVWEQEEAGVKRAPCITLSKPAVSLCACVQSLLILTSSEQWYSSSISNMNRSSWSPCRRQEQSHSTDAAQHGAGSRSGDSVAGSPLHRAARSRRHLEGVLKKYTNLLHGWQSRWVTWGSDRRQ